VAQQPLKSSTLLFPVGGLNKRASFQQQPPYTTPDCLNVRADDAETERTRGGSRPGLKKTLASQIGGGNPIRMLGKVRESGGTDEFSVFEHFDSFTVQNQTVATHLAQWDSDGQSEFQMEEASRTTTATTPTFPTSWVGVSKTTPPTQDNGNSFVALESQTPWDTVVVSIRINEHAEEDINGFGNNDYASIILRLDDTTPESDQNGIEVKFEPDAVASPDNLAVSVIARSGGSDTSKLSTTDNMTSTGGNSEEPKFPMIVEVTYRSSTASSNANEIDIRAMPSYDTDPSEWHTVASSVDVSADVGGTAGTDERIGFGVTPDMFVDWFQAVFSSSTTASSYGRERLVGVSNGLVYRENLTDWEAVTMGNVLIDDANHLEAVEHSGKLYIADHELVHDSITTSDPSGDKVLTDTTISDFEAAGAILTGETITSAKWAAGFVVEVYDSASDDGVYEIASVSGSAITVTAASNFTGGANVNYRIFRSIKEYNAAANTIAKITESVSNTPPPAGCPLIARYRGRLVIAGAEPNPSIWYMSRSNDPGDWDFSANDTAAAVAGNATEAGVIGEPIKALIAAGDDYLIFGCTDSIYVLKGDLPFGQIDNVSRQTGIVNRKAWCILPDGTVLFLSRNEGVNAISGGRVVELSRRVLPDEFEGLDPDDEHYMVYDPEDQGVYLFITSQKGTSSQWFFDPSVNSYWPMQFANSSHYVHSVLTDNAAPGLVRRALIGCADGYLRNFDDAQYTDDGTAISSYVYIGPIRASGNGRDEGLLESLTATMGENSNTANWALGRGDDAEEAVGYSTAFASGTFPAGRGYTKRPRMRCGSFVVKVSNGDTVTAPWSMESIQIERRPAGRQILS